MAFHEDWFDDHKQARLQAEMRLVTAEGSVVEVGCWEGRSTIAIARHFGHAIAIDHWRGDLTDPTSPVAELAAQRDVYADFRQNVDEAGVDVTVMRTDWREVDWPALRPIRFLFIDGQHTYDEVADNILAAQPHMTAGGVIAGDDYATPGVCSAVTDLLGDARHDGGLIWGVSLV